MSPDRPEIIVGALGEGMLRLAGAEADGVLLNYLPAGRVPWCVQQVRRGGARVCANVHTFVAAIEGPGARFVSDAPCGCGATGS